MGFVHQPAGDGGRLDDAFSSSLSGEARDVVQARDINGGVHFHSAAAETPVPRQLPGDIPVFVGRDRELAVLHDVLANDASSMPLILLVGTAGAGKTALALHFSHRVRNLFPDGQLFVNLRGYDAGPAMAPAAALERFLRALGTPPPAIPAGLEERAGLFRSLLAERRMLLVLDNAGIAAQVRPLLPGEPRCLVIVTSRGRLSALSSRDGAHRVDLGLLTQEESVTLIDSVTGRYRQGDDPAQVAHLARLCARLPLALRIAAERAAARPRMPLAELLEDLRGESSLWDALSDDGEQEADTVRAVFAWSYRALPPAVARAFRLLGVHPGPDMDTSAVAALLGEASDRVRVLLDALAGAHLIEQTEARRYQFHDLLRAYAADQAGLEESGETRGAALLGLARWYLFTGAGAVRALYPQFAEPPRLAPDPAIKPAEFADELAAMDWFRRERANLLAVCRAAYVGGLDEIASQIPDTLFLIYEAASAHDDLGEAAEIGLKAARRSGDRLGQARALRVRGFAYKIAGALRKAAACQRDSLAVLESLDLPNETMLSANALGLVQLELRELRDAEMLFEQTRVLAQAGGMDLWDATALDNLAAVHKEAGRYVLAIDMAQRAIAAYRQAGADAQLAVVPLLHLARVHRETGDLRRAEAYMDQAAEVLADAHFVSIECNLLLERAALENALGRSEQALETYWRALQMQRPLGDRSREASVYTGLGQVLVGLGRAQESLDFHHRAVALRGTHPDAYAHAEALSSLSEAFEAVGQADRALAARNKAAALLGAFEDPRAAALRERLRAG